MRIKIRITIYDDASEYVEEFGAITAMDNVLLQHDASFGHFRSAVGNQAVTVASKVIAFCDQYIREAKENKQ